MLKRLVRQQLSRMGYTVFLTGTVPNHLETSLAAIFKQYEVDCVLDVGANVGQYAQSLRRMGFNGHIVSFEPMARAFTALAKAAEDDPKWHCLNIALGDVSEDKTIKTIPDFDVFSSFRPLNDYAHTRWKDTRRSQDETVRVERLDGQIETIRRLTACSSVHLKLDTQGYDLQVFRGASGALEPINSMQSELAYIHLYEELPDVSLVMKEYESQGFRLCSLHPVSRDESYALIEADGIFVKKPA